MDENSDPHGAKKKKEGERFWGVFCFLKKKKN